MARGRKPTRKMARGGRTRPVARGRRMQTGGYPPNQPRGGYRGGRNGGRPPGCETDIDCPAGQCCNPEICGHMPGCCKEACMPQRSEQTMRRGGRTRPAPRGRKFQAGGHSHNAGHSHGPYGDAYASGSWDVGNGGHQHGTAPPPQVQTPLRSRGPATRRSGGRVTHQLRRGGRPAPRGRGRQMARGGRAPARKFQGGGQSICPVGTERLADGRCAPMGS